MNPSVAETQAPIKFRWYLLATFASAAVLLSQGSTLRTPEMPLGIISLELAFDRLEPALLAYNEAQRLVFCFNVAFDYLFAFCYSATIIKALSLVMTRSRLRMGLSVMAGMAGALDMIENAFMYLTLRVVVSPQGTLNQQGAVYAGLAGYAASTKFVLLVLVLGALLYAAIRYARSPMHKPASP